MNKQIMVHYTMEYTPAIENDKQCIHAITHIILKCLMLSERSKMKKISFIQNVIKGRLTVWEILLMVAWIQGGIGC